LECCIEWPPLAKEVGIINKEYGRVNADAEVFTTGDRDYRRAMNYERAKTVQAEDVGA
jgi:hypothetical protein